MECGTQYQYVHCSHAVVSVERVNKQESMAQIAEK